MKQEINIALNELMKQIEILELQEKINTINEIKKSLHLVSPFKNEPVDCVIWTKQENVIANDYNPNVVAPPEMELLKVSISEDGYTQPVVTYFRDNINEVVDGFHRTRVAKECDEVKSRIYGYIPTVCINELRTEKSDRIASTIRHNRARGKHQIQSMSDIVIELKNRNWSNDRICKELGMEQDEVLRLCQITGLSELFSDENFSKSWDINDSEPDSFIPLDDNFGTEIKEQCKFRTINTSDPDRIFHTFEKWECFKAGFYDSSKDGMTKEQCEQEYAKLLTNEKEFSKALNNVVAKWKNSCEHYLTNNSMNRIAYLGQAALCYARGIPSIFRSGFNLLSKEQQDKANNTALKYLNKWLKKHNRKEVSLDEAMTDRQSTIY